MSEDVYDVGGYEVATMVCQRCGAVFKQHEIDNDYWDPETGEGLLLMEDEECPSCGGELERV